MLVYHLETVIRGNFTAESEEKNKTLHSPLGRVSLLASVYDNLALEYPGPLPHWDRL